VEIDGSFEGKEVLEVPPCAKRNLVTVRVEVVPRSRKIRLHDAWTKRVAHPRDQSVVDQKLLAEAADQDVSEVRGRLGAGLNLHSAARACARVTADDARTIDIDVRRD